MRGAIMRLHKVIISLFFIIVSLQTCTTVADEIPDWKIKEAEKQVEKLNNLINEQGLKWKAGITSFS